MELDLATLFPLALAAGFAGFIDAVAGGGGLVQLPALLVGLPGRPIPLILGTNKIPSICGTTTAGLNYFRRARPDPEIALCMALPAFLGALGGAHLAAVFPARWFRPLILLLLAGVAWHTWRRPELGMEERLRHTPARRRALVAGFGLALGFYDGIFGPGTGTFLLFVLVAQVGYAFLKASATAKLVNIATNLAAILSFQSAGLIWWRLGLTLAVANVAGALVGTHLALRGGSPLVRRVFLAVTALLIARIAFDWLRSAG